MELPLPQRATIRITDLRLRTIVGFNEWERKEKQEVVINASFDFNPSKAVQSDRVEDSVDYRQVKKRIIALVENSEFFLLEKLTHEVLKEVISEPGVLGATIRIDKPHALRFAQSASVEMSLAPTLAIDSPRYV